MLNANMMLIKWCTSDDVIPVHSL